MKKKIWEFRVKFQEEDEYIRQWGENDRWGPSDGKSVKYVRLDTDTFDAYFILCV